MSKTRYTDATGDRIVATMRELGSARSVYTALGISSGVYYAWLRQKPELALRVEIAQREFSQSQDIENIAMAKEWLIRLLKEGDRTTRKTTRQIIVAGQIFETEETIKIQRPCPSWVIDRILGNLEEMNAVKTLATGGFLSDRTAAAVCEILEETQEKLKAAIAENEQN